MAGIERPPSAAEKHLEPRTEVHRKWRDWHPDVTEITCGVSRWNIECSAERNRQMLKVATDPNAFGVDTERSASAAREFVTKRDVVVDPAANRLHAFPPAWDLPKQLARGMEQQIDLAVPAAHQEGEHLRR